MRKNQDADTRRWHFKWRDTDLRYTRRRRKRQRLRGDPRAERTRELLLASGSVRHERVVRVSEGPRIAWKRRKPWSTAAAVAVPQVEGPGAVDLS